MGELYYWKLIMGVYIAGALLVLAPPFALLTGAFNSIYPHGNNKLILNQS
jgi:hypothetical protein